MLLRTNRIIIILVLGVIIALLSIGCLTDRGGETWTVDELKKQYPELNEVDSEINHLEVKLCIVEADAVWPQRPEKVYVFDRGDNFLFSFNPETQHGSRLLSVLSDH